jgi:hypothetical protein
MSAHDDFLEGFADALGLTDPEQVQYHYQNWIEASGLNPVELIDIEQGYQTGLEAGSSYKREFL